MLYDYLACGLDLKICKFLILKAKKKGLNCLICLSVSKLLCSNIICAGILTYSKMNLLKFLILKENAFVCTAQNLSGIH